MSCAKTPVAILISGGGSNMVSLLQDMQADPDHPCRPVVVVSNRPDAVGLEKARAAGVPAETVPHKGRDRHEFEAMLAQTLEKYGPELICLAGFMRILTPAFIRAHAGKMLNIHPSLLPLYKGLHTHARAIAAGDLEAGCSVHEVSAELDGGPVLGQARVPILPGDTPESLAARILPLEHALYPRILRRFAQGERRFLAL